MDFRDRHVVVTGGAGALGTAVVAALIEAGAICHVPCYDEAEAKRFRLRDHKQVALTVTGNLADEAAVTRALCTASAAVGVDPYRRRLCRRAAARRRRGDDPPADRHELRQLHAVLPRRGQGDDGRRRGGRIVNVSARAGLEWRSGAGMTAYTASKAAVAALTAALAEEVAKDGILVNAVAPSIMDTPANRHAMPKADYALWPKVEEVAATILFLASPDNRVTRGAVVPVYGKS